MKKIYIFLVVIAVVFAGKQGIHSIDQKSYLEFKYHGPGSMSYNIVGANNIAFNVYLLTQENYIAWVSNTANKPNFIPDGSRLGIFQASMSNYQITDTKTYYIVIYNGDDRNILRVSYDIDMVPVCSTAQQNSQATAETKHDKHAIEGMAAALAVLGFAIFISLIAWYKNRKTEVEQSNPEEGKPNETTPLVTDVDESSTITDLSQRTSVQGSPASQRSAQNNDYISRDVFSETISERHVKAEDVDLEYQRK